MSSHIRWSILVSLIFVGIGALGCAGTKAPPVEPVAEPAPEDSPPALAATPAQPGQPVSGQPEPVPPPATPPAASTQATPLPPASAAAATPILMGLGQSEAPGAKPYGAVFAGQFLEGQILEQPINLQAGKCYTVVAVGDGIQQLDLQLVMSTPPMPPTVVAQSSTTGATAVLGGKASGCFKNPLPMAAPGKIIMKATRGAGTAAGQAYVK